MHVLIAGCGWLGTSVGVALKQLGHRVTGLRRGAGDTLRAAGLEPLQLDLVAPGAALRLPGDLDAIVACQAADGESVEAYRATYLDATRTLLDATRRRPVRAFVYTGSTGVFGQRDGSDVGEHTPVAPVTPTGAVLAEAERQVLGAHEHGVPTRLVRLSGLYGPGRYGVVERVRSGRLSLGPGDGIWTNWCHLADAVALVLAALDRGRDGAIYHGSDADPATRRVLVEWVAQRFGFAAHRRTDLDPAPSRRGGTNRRISGARTRAELGLELQFPSFREGLEPCAQTSRRT